MSVPEHRSDFLIPKLLFRVVDVLLARCAEARGYFSLQSSTEYMTIKESRPIEVALSPDKIRQLEDAIAKNPDAGVTDLKESL